MRCNCGELANTECGFCRSPLCGDCGIQLRGKAFCDDRCADDDPEVDR